MSSWRLQPFHVQEIYFLEFTKVPRHIPLFIDGYKRFTAHTFIYWQLRMFYAKALSFLVATKISRHLPLFFDGYRRSHLNPLFLDNYECFLSKLLLSWRLRTFLIFKKSYSTNSAFCQNPSLPLLFPSLLLTCNSIGSRLVMFQYVRHSNSFR